MLSLLTLACYSNWPINVQRRVTLLTSESAQSSGKTNFLFLLPIHAHPKTTENPKNVIALMNRLRVGQRGGGKCMTGKNYCVRTWRPWNDRQTVLIWIPLKNVGVDFRDSFAYKRLLIRFPPPVLICCLRNIPRIIMYNGLKFWRNYLRAMVRIDRFVFVLLFLPTIKRSPWNILYSMNTLFAMKLMFLSCFNFLCGRKWLWNSV